MLSRWAGVVGAVLLLGTPLSGIDRDLRIDQMHHTSWTHKDGVPTQIQALAQTTDGFLWIGDLTGLYRFDGLYLRALSTTRWTVSSKSFGVPFVRSAGRRALDRL
jgi:ligand-binding sensor domain-containing protein